MLLQAESKNRHAVLDADNCSLRPKSTGREVFLKSSGKNHETVVYLPAENENGFGMTTLCGNPRAGLSTTESYGSTAGFALWICAPRERFQKNP